MSYEGVSLELCFFVLFFFLCVVLKTGIILIHSTD